MFSACPQLAEAWALVTAWLRVPGTGRGLPGTAGGCAVPVVRTTTALAVLGLEKLMARLYSAILVTLTTPMGSPMLLLWPNAPARARPMYAMAFRLSAPIAFEAAATTAAASWATAPSIEQTIRSKAMIAGLISMTTCYSLIRKMCIHSTEDQGAYEHEAKEHDLPLVQQGRARRRALLRRHLSEQ